MASNRHGREHIVEPIPVDPDEHDLLGSRMAALIRQGRWEQAQEVLRVAWHEATIGRTRPRESQGLDTPLVEVVDLRTANILEAAGVHTVRDLVALRPTQLLAVRGLGLPSIRTLREAVDRFTAEFCRGTCRPGARQSPQDHA